MLVCFLSEKRTSYTKASFFQWPRIEYTSFLVFNLSPYCQNQSRLMMENVEKKPILFSLDIVR